MSSFVKTLTVAAATAFLLGACAGSGPAQSRGCTTQNSLGGAGVGAAGGAAIGLLAGGTTGAIAGGLLGGATGALVGSQVNCPDYSFRDQRRYK